MKEQFSAKILQIIVGFALTLASRLYESSRGIFWLIIIAGGSFGLGLAWFLFNYAIAFCISISEKIQPSVKGTRYKTAAIIMACLFLLDLIACIVTNLTGIQLAIQIVFDVLVIIMSFVLFILGKKE